MKRLKYLAIPALLIIIMAVTLLMRSGVPTKAHAATATICSWSVVSSPNVGTSSSLYKVAAIAVNDIWAAGYGTDSTGTSLTLTEHWNGSAWSVVASPNVGSNGSALSSITAISTSDVWAAGYSTASSGFSQTLIEHWDGSAWSIVASPNIGSNGNQLFGITAISSTNIWAVGSYTNSSGAIRTLIEHWDGSAWSIVASPNADKHYNNLSAIKAVSASNIWAIGYTGAPVSGQVHKAEIEHWNGKAWSIVPSPNIVGSNDFLADVSVISANNIWAVGASQDNNYQTAKTLIEHWNGTKWSIVTSPNPDPTNNFLSGVTQVPGTTSVWAVGNTGNGSPTQTLTEFHC